MSAIELHQMIYHMLYHLNSFLSIPDTQLSKLVNDICSLVMIVINFDTSQNTKNESGNMQNML